MFDIKGAREEGYTDGEILDYLKQKHADFDYAGAEREGYTVDEIAEYLGSKESPVIETPKVEAPSSTYLKPKEPTVIDALGYTKPPQSAQLPEPMGYAPKKIDSVSFTPSLSDVTKTNVATKPNKQQEQVIGAMTKNIPFSQKPVQQQVQEEYKTPTFNIPDEVASKIKVKGAEPKSVEWYLKASDKDKQEIDKYLSENDKTIIKSFKISPAQAYGRAGMEALTYGLVGNKEDLAIAQQAQPVATTIGSMAGMSATAPSIGTGLSGALAKIPAVAKLASAGKFGEAAYNAVTRGVVSGTDAALRNRDALLSDDPEERENAKKQIANAYVAGAVSGAPEFLLGKGLIQIPAQAAASVIYDAITTPMVTGGSAFDKDNGIQTAVAAVQSALFAMNDISRPQAKKPVIEKAGEPVELVTETAPEVKPEEIKPEYKSAPREVSRETRRALLEKGMEEGRPPQDKLKDLYGDIRPTKKQVMADLGVESREEAGRIINNTYGVLEQKTEPATTIEPEQVVPKTGEEVTPIEQLPALEKLENKPVPKEILNRKLEVQRKVADIKDPKDRLDIESQLMDEHLGDYGVTKFSDANVAMKQLHELNIPFAYERDDGLNLGGANAVLGHSGADKAIKEVWGGVFAKRVQENGGMVFRGTGDELKVLWPNKTAGEAEKIRSEIQKEVDAKVSELGLDEIGHSKKDNAPTGAMNLHYGISDYIPGKIGEMDRIADYGANEMKSNFIVDKLSTKGYTFNKETNKYEYRGVSDKTRVKPENVGAGTEGTPQKLEAEPKPAEKPSEFNAGKPAGEQHIRTVGARKKIRIKYEDGASENPNIADANREILAYHLAADDAGLKGDILNQDGGADQWRYVESGLAPTKDQYGNLIKMTDETRDLLQGVWDYYETTEGQKEAQKNFGSKNPFSDYEDVARLIADAPRKTVKKKDGTEEFVPSKKALDMAIKRHKAKDISDTEGMYAFDLEEAKKRNKELEADRGIEQGYTTHLETPTLVVYSKKTNDGIRAIAFSGDSFDPEFDTVFKNKKELDNKINESPEVMFQRKEIAQGDLFGGEKTLLQLQQEQNARLQRQQVKAKIDERTGGAADLNLPLFRGTDAVKGGAEQLALFQKKQSEAPKLTDAEKARYHDLFNKENKTPEETKEYLSLDDKQKARSKWEATPQLTIKEKPQSRGFTKAIKYGIEYAKKNIPMWDAAERAFEINKEVPNTGVNLDLFLTAYKHMENGTYPSTKYDQHTPEARQRSSALIGALRVERKRGDSRWQKEAEKESTGLSKEVAQAHLDKFGNKNAIAVGSEKEFPENVKNNIKKYKAEGQVRAAYDLISKKAYFVAKDFSDASDLEKAFKHEIFGHHGIREVLGNKIGPTLDSIYTKYENTTIGKRIKKDYFGEDWKDTVKQRRILAEEVLAKIAETNENPTLLKQVIAKIRYFLRQIAPGIKWSDDDIRSLLASAERRAKYQSGIGGESAFQKVKQKADDLYSNAERAVENIDMPKAPASQWLSMLDPAKGKGTKADEMKWIGLDDFLKEKGNQSVTKQDIMDFIDQNKVQLEEVEKGITGKDMYIGPDTWGDETPMTKEEWKQAIDEGNSNFRQWYRDEKQEFEMNKDPDEEGDFLSWEEYRQDLLGELKSAESETGNTNFSDYQLPGGENYREVLLKLPFKPISYESFRANRPKLTEERARQLYEDYKARKITATEDEEGYKSRHWDERRVLAHYRLNDRTDSEGKKVLFIEEIQSDWHQEGRKKGYKREGEALTDKEDLEYRELNDKYEKIKYKDDKEVKDEDVKKEMGSKDFDRYKELHEKLTGVTSNIPQAPFSKTWHELAFKKILREAAEKGYDKVAWTTGEQQAERYDLSKQIKSIYYAKKTDGGNTFYDLDIMTKEGRDIRRSDLSESELEANIGKETAQKIIENKEDSGSLTGLDLKVGGEGMKGFYDKILVDYANKYGKKWGAKVSESEIPIKAKELAKVHSMDITPEMKESVVYEGQPMFQKVQQQTMFDPQDLFSTEPIFKNQDTGEEKKLVEAKQIELFKPEEIKPEKATKEIQDFGKKIGGARKDYFSDYKDKFEKSDSVNMTEEPLSKSWPEPDYEKLIEGGHDKWVVGFIRAAREEVPAKPSVSYRLDRWAREAKLLKDMSRKLLDGEYTKEKIKEKLKQSEYYTVRVNVGSRADLYEEFGHGKSLKGITLEEHKFNFYRGEKDVNKWMIEQRQKSTAFNNMPRILGEGNTKQEAIDDFRKKYNAIEDAPKGEYETAFVVYQRRDTGKFWIAKKMGAKRYLELKSFGTAKEALEYKRSHNKELTAQLERMKEIPSERREFNRERIGQDHRKGKDVTPEMFNNDFGFRGVEFGNWVNSSERQDNLNRTFDALHDLSSILGVPTKALSLNGELGLGFGSRGHGGVNAPSAHYEADRIVINLTKKSGAGSLAHEWWHALDNYLSRKRGKADDFITNNPNLRTGDTTRKELIDAFNNVMKAIKKTGLKDRSEILDTKRTKDYWSTDIEMSARVFENYVIDKLKDMGATNDYLANVATSPEYAKALADIVLKNGERSEAEQYPYLFENEIADVKPELDKLFKTIQTKETDQGIALFQRKLLDNEPVGPNGEPISINEKDKTVKIKGVEVAVSEALKDREYMEDLYKRNRDATKKIDKSKPLDVKKHAENILTPISSRLRRISEGLMHEERKYEHALMLMREEWNKPAISWLEAKKKMSLDDKKDLDLAEKNRDIDKINEIVTKHKLENEYNAKREMLAKAYKQAKESGLDMGYLANYAHRSVIDYSKFVSGIKGTEHWSLIKEAVDKWEKKNGRPITTDEIAEISDKLLMGRTVEGLKLSRPGATKEQVVGLIDEKTNQYYQSSDLALIKYIESMTEAISMRKFFKGSLIVEEGKIDLDKTIGAFVAKLSMEGKIDYRQEQEISEILKARFNPGRISTFGQWIKNISYIDTMGSPYSAITQIQDQAFAVYHSGAINAAIGLANSLGKKKITIEDLGISKIAIEFTEPSKSANVLERTFKWVGFERMDRLGKETFINAAAIKYKNMAKNNPEKLIARLTPMIGDGAKQAVIDFKSGVLSPDVKYVLFSDLLDFQPAAMSEVPLSYLKASNGKIFYMLKTYTLKQLDIFRREIIDTAKTNQKQAAINAVKLAGMFVAMGMATDAIRDFFSGRPTIIKDTFFDNCLKMVGLTKYQIVSFKQDGAVLSVTKMITPPFQLIESIIRDGGAAASGKLENVKDLETFKSVPGIGKAFYWWLGGGHEKTEKKKHKVPSNKNEEMAKLMRSNKLEDKKKFAEDFRKLDAQGRVKFYKDAAEFNRETIQSIQNEVNGKPDKNGVRTGGILEKSKMSNKKFIAAKKILLRDRLTSGLITREVFDEKMKALNKLEDQE